MPSVETANYLVGLGTLALQIVSIGFLVLFLMRNRLPDLGGVVAFLGKWGLWIAFLSTGAGIGIALYYSEVYGILPCSLCWIQRIFLFPQFILFGLALWKKESAIADYSIALSAAGAVVALYQHYLQMGGASILPCPPTASEAVDCSVRFLFELGYITFPLVSFTLFAFLIVVMLFVRARNS